MKLWMVWVISCLGLALCAAETESEIKTDIANRQFTARDYQRAEQEYGKILQLPMWRWQKEIVMYNRGTALLAQKKWNEALSQFQQIAPSATSFPLLVISLKKNLAITRLFQGIQLSQNQSDTEDHFISVVYILKNALMNAEEAQKAECSLQRIEGSQVCEVSENLRAITREIRIQLASAIQVNQQKQLSQFSPENGIPLLLTGVNAIIEDLHFLESQAFTSSQEEAYKEWFLSNAQSWIFLWKTLQPFFEKESQSPFHYASDDFKLALDKMQQGRWKESLEHLNLAEKNLQNLLQKIWKGRPFMSLLQRLNQSYLNLELQDSLSTLALVGLLEEQKQLQEWGKDQIRTGLQKSTQNLEKSVHFMKEKNDVLGRFYFEEAEQELKNVMDQQEGGGKTDAQELLRRAIEKQRFALKINQLQQKMPKQIEEVQKIVQNRQTETFAEIPQFLEAVVNMQQKNTHDQFSEKDWKDILSFVGSGYEKARAAEKNLQTPESNFAKVASLQEQAVEDWFTALEKLKNLQQAQQPQKQNTSSSTQPAEQKMNQVFKMAQEMEKSDRALKQAYAPASINQGDKPW